MAGPVNYLSILYLGLGNVLSMHILLESGLC